jgi:hypothetical protein
MLSSTEALVQKFCVGFLVLVFFERVSSPAYVIRFYLVTMNLNVLQ